MWLNLLKRFNTVKSIIYIKELLLNGSSFCFTSEILIDQWALQAPAANNYSCEV